MITRNGGIKCGDRSRTWEPVLMSQVFGSTVAIRITGRLRAGVIFAQFGSRDFFELFGVTYSLGGTWKTEKQGQSIPDIPRFTACSHYLCCPYQASIAD
jgi:hypothetical protein